MLRTILPIIAAVATLLSGLLAYNNWKSAGMINELRGEVKSYIAEAKAADANAARAEIAAQESIAAKEKAQSVAKQHADKARELTAQLAQVKAVIPSKGNVLDTLTAHIAVVRDSVSLAVQASESWQKAYESQLEATARIQAAVDTLRPALAAERAANAKLAAGSKKLVEKTGGSFWKKLVPTIHVGVTAGVNPQGKMDVVAGVGPGWTF